MMLFHLLLTVFRTVAALPSPHESAVHQVYDFPNKGSWLENLAVRSNGYVLASRLDVPQLYQFSPLSPISEPTLIHTFPSTGLTGVTELAGHPEVFAVITGNFTTMPSNCTVWRVDMCQPAPIVTKIAESPQASTPNGMVSLDADEHAVLISDSSLGNVWRFDL